MELNEDFEKYFEAWLKKQVEIWKEKIEERHIIDTGALHQSFQTFIMDEAQGKTLTMQFAKYGIYQALGVGYGYAHRYVNPHGTGVQEDGSRNGVIPFLDETYREENRLNRKRKVGPSWGGGKPSGKVRNRRDWISKKLYMSIMAMREDLARIAGEDITGVICDAMNDLTQTIHVQ